MTLLGMPMHKRREWLAIEVQRLRRWYAAGHPLAWMAVQLQRSPRSVAGSLDRFGLRVAIPHLAAYAKDMRRLHAKGLSDRAIARKLNLPRSTIWHWRRRLDLPRNDPPGQRGYAAACRNYGVATLAEVRWLPQRLARFKSQRPVVDDIAIPVGGRGIPRTLREPHIYHLSHEVNHAVGH